jgi:CheY-like chemotaxis protein
VDSRVLFVDDEVPILEGYRRILHREFDVSAANSGEEGLELVRTGGPFAVVISDMRMPGMNGAEFLARVRERAPDTVRMLLTGYSDMEAAIEAVNEGNIFRYLTKPCEKKAIVDAIQSGVAQYDATRANKELIKKAQLITRSTLDWGSQSLTPSADAIGAQGLPGGGEAREYLDSLFRGARVGYVALIKLTILEIIEDRYGTEAAEDYVRSTVEFLKKALSPGDRLFHWSRGVLMIVVGRQLSAVSMRTEIARLMQDRRETITEAGGRKIMVAAPTAFDLIGLSGFANFDELFAGLDARLTGRF